MAAFADLNISKQSDPRKTENLILKAVKLGFQTIAINTTFILKGEKQKKSEKSRLSPFNWDDYPKIQALKRNDSRLKFITRLTVPLDEQSQVHQLSSENVLSYDILAVQPSTDKLFHQACTSLAIDVIALDMTVRLPFFLRFPTVSAAIERGVHFEIIYSNAIRDNTQRRYLISNALELVTFTRGKNIIISSGAENQMDFRGPYDLVNLGLLFHLKNEQSKAAVSRNCRAVLFHSESRKGSWRSVVSGKATTSLSNDEMWALTKSRGGDDISEDERSGVSDNEEEIGDEGKSSGDHDSNEVTSDEYSDDNDDDFEPEQKKAKL